MTQPTIPIRPTTEIDQELQSTARVYVAMSRYGALGEKDLLLIFMRAATLMWVLQPTLNEISAQEAAWKLIAEIKETTP